MNKLKKDFAFQFAYRILTVITPLITSPYLSRTLGPEKLGIFSGTYAYANYFILFSILGIEFFGNRSIAVVSESKTNRKEVFWNIYAIQFFAAFISILIYYLTFGAVFDESRRLICCLQGLWIVASGLDINWYFFGKQEFKLTVTRNIIIKVLTIVCIFIFVKNASDLSKYVVIMAFGMVLSNGVLWFFLLKDIGICRPKFRDVRKNIKPVLILFIPVLAMSIFHIMDKTMVDLLSTEANSGYYYNVDRLVNLPLGLITGIGTVMMPRISKLAHEKDSFGTVALLKKSSELTIFLASAIAFGIGSISNTFVPVFFGVGYEPCIMMLEIFVPIIIIKALSDFIRQQYLIPAKQDKLYITAVFLGAVVNIICNYFLILRYGALGAVFGVLITEALVLFIEIVGCKNELNFLHMFSMNTAYIIIGALMFVLVKFIEKISCFEGFFRLIVLICVGGIFYAILCCGYWLKTQDSIFKPYICKLFGK